MLSKSPISAVISHRANLWNAVLVNTHI
jgi:hypothetical protein